MNISQGIPTDNLYKFTSIAGLVLFIFFSLLFGYVLYLKDISDKASQMELGMFRTYEVISKAKCRLLELELGDSVESEKCKFSDLKELNTIEEIQYMLEVLDRNERYVKSYENLSKEASIFDSNFKFVGKYHIHLIFGLFYAISICMVVFGFIRWRKKIQLPMNKAIELNEQVKTLEIKCKEYELENLKYERIKVINEIKILKKEV